MPSHRIWIHNTAETYSTIYSSRRICVSVNCEKRNRTRGIGSFSPFFSLNLPTQCNNIASCEQQYRTIFAVSAERNFSAITREHWEYLITHKQCGEKLKVEHISMRFYLKRVFFALSLSLIFHSLFENKINQSTFISENERERERLTIFRLHMLKAHQTKQFISVFFYATVAFYTHTYSSRGIFIVIRQLFFSISFWYSSLRSITKTSSVFLCLWFLLLSQFKAVHVR